MKLIDALKNVDRSSKNTTWVGEEFYEAVLGQYVYLDSAPRITGYYLAPWLCTDTWVGGNVYYLDDEPLAWGFQTARKNKEEFRFVDADVLSRARDYLRSLLTDEGTISFIDPDEEIGETYGVHYTTQLLDRRGYVNGRTAVYLPVETQEWLKKNVPAKAYGYTFPGADAETYRESILVVEYADETQEAIDIKRFDIPFRVVNSG